MPRSFYARPVLTVARDVIGKVLVHQTPQGTIAGRIVEAEAYRGPQDRAAHSFGGRRTERTEAMFGPPGFAYVFFVYGMHWHVNLVTTREGEPHAVLLRAVEPLVGAELMAARRGGMSPNDVSLCNGPGKLCQAFGIDKRHYAADLTRGSLFLSEAPRPRGKLGRSARIGVDYAESWAEKPWRFFELGNRWVSRARPSKSKPV
ncbi:MAG TPA: DNA-3-methyladenine glycosylase [Polyangiaceae bacterium]|nr:DNA-3-methyladenine glycosylase [Polyangiaceae bacterium]